jgi:hypothetical protein
MPLRSKWAAGKGSVSAGRRIGVSGDAFSQRVVGTRSGAIRSSTSDDRVGCSASDGRCAPARPALDVSTRPLPFLPCGLSIIAPSVNVLRRTRRKPSTIRGAAPDVVIGQSTAARAGARPTAPAKWLGPITPTVYTNDSTLTEAKAFVSVIF